MAEPQKTAPKLVKVIFNTPKVPHSRSSYEASDGLTVDYAKRIVSIPGGDGNVYEYPFEGVKAIVREDK